MYNCITDINGDPICKNVEQPAIKKALPYDLASGQHLPGPIPKGAKQACSGSCLNPEDCDTNSDCLCASNKGMHLTGAPSDALPFLSVNFEKSPSKGIKVS